MSISVANQRAVVLFSGGQDSTTCLAWALERFSAVDTIGFEYGQRHSIEMQCRLRVLEEVRRLNEDWSNRLGEDTVLSIEALSRVSETALTKEVAFEMDAAGYPNTYVPGRNLLFLTLSGALAHRRGARNLVGGMCETDFSGYPDCRDDAIKALQVALNLGMGQNFVIHTPLMWIDKAATWQLAHDLGGADLVEVIRQETHTCYKGDRSKLHEWGYGCGECPACELRAIGWQTFASGRPNWSSAHSNKQKT